MFRERKRGSTPKSFLKFFLKSTLPRTTSVERSRSWTMARLAMNSVATVKYKFGINMQSDTASFVLAINSGVETARLGNLSA